MKTHSENLSKNLPPHQEPCVLGIYVVIFSHPFGVTFGSNRKHLFPLLKRKQPDTVHLQSNCLISSFSTVKSWAGR